MNELDQQIETIELQKEQARKMIDMGKAVDRLMKNRDFKKVVLEEFFREEAIRLVLLKSDPNFASTDQQENLDRSIHGIGLFRQFLQTKSMLAQQASAAMDDLDEELDAIRAEETEA